jgi:DNA topoisomerase-3
MKSLIIAEKSSVAKDIANALGGFRKHDDGYFERDDLIVSSAVGHLVELHVPEAEGRAKGFPGLPILPDQFGLKPIDRTASQFYLLQKLLNSGSISKVYNACDAGREGELIFGLIMEHANCRKPVQRMWFQTMTAEGLRDAYVNARPGDERAGLLAAAKCRNEGDWLIGINGSRGFTALRTKTLGSYEAMNTGRVQTPTLAILVDRENEILSFKSVPYWEVNGLFTAAAGQYKGKLINPHAQGGSEASESDGEAGSSKHRFMDQRSAQALLQRCQGQPVESVKQEVTDGSSKPPTLFDLTTLQREANKRFNFTAKKTLGIAQALYETHKMTTYPRTDGTALPEDYVDTTKATFAMLKGSPWDVHVGTVLSNNWVDGTNKRVFDNSKITDHFAIVPTGAFSPGLSEDERKIYELIVLRYIAAFFPNAKTQKTKRITTVAGVDFLSSGSVVIDPGWMAVIKETGEDGKLKGGPTDLCHVAEGETPRLTDIQLTEAKTAPPARFSEATLLGAMETAGKHVEDEELRAAMKERGLGTPATRASIIEGLCDTGTAEKPKTPYVQRKERHLIPTEKAMNLISFARANGIAFLTKADMTGEWESKLKRMETGDYERPRFMAEIRAQTEQMIETLRDQDAKVVVQTTPLGAPCPKCRNAQVVATLGGFSCEAECGFRMARTLARRPMSDVEMKGVLEGKTVGPLSGFFSSKTKKTFEAHLKLGEGKFEFVFLEKALKCPCPKCDGPMLSKPGAVECKECKYLVYRKCAGRSFSDAEFETLLSKGSIKSLSGFASSKDPKKKFSAGVALSLADGKVSFVFDEQAKKGAKK